MSSPGHLEKCEWDLITPSLAILESQAPRVLRWGEDVEELSREESRAYWLSVGCKSSDEERVLDQILNSEDEDISNKKCRTTHAPLTFDLVTSKSIGVIY